MSVSDPSFATIVRDLVVNEQDYAYEMSQTTPPERTYVIMFMARSGSSWLTSLLSGTNALGYPEEYINPNFVADVARSLNSREQDGFLKILQRRRKTANGMFGMEVRAYDIYHFGPEIFFRHFGYETLFFNLWRENLIAQAISLYRAMATGRWHSYETPAALPAYNADEIERLATQLLNEENDNVQMLRRHGRRARPLRYEAMVNDRPGTLRLFADALGVTLDPQHYAQPQNGEHEKIGDFWNEDTEHRFRTDRPNFADHAESLRQVRK